MVRWVVRQVVRTVVRTVVEVRVNTQQQWVWVMIGYEMMRLVRTGQ